jgi:hypothetical protein
MTNILLIPQMTATFHIVTNADWVDQIIIPIADNPTSPLDITGIDFYSELRALEDDPNILISMSTQNGLLINEGANGKLRWQVRYDALRDIKVSSGVLDILALADGNRVNLFQEAGPADVAIRAGVTRI